MTRTSRDTAAKPRSESRQRPMLVGVRLTGPEHAWLVERAACAGVTVPTLLRRAALQQYHAKGRPANHPVQTTAHPGGGTNAEALQ